MPRPHEKITVSIVFEKKKRNYFHSWEGIYLKNIFLNESLTICSFLYLISFFITFFIRTKYVFPQQQIIRKYNMNENILLLFLTFLFETNISQKYTFGKKVLLVAAMWNCLIKINVELCGLST